MTSPPPDVAADAQATRTLQSLRHDADISAVAGGGTTAGIAGDILYGADQIATFLFGDRKHRRRVLQPC